MHSPGRQWPFRSSVCIYKPLDRSSSGHLQRANNCSVPPCLLAWTFRLPNSFLPIRLVTASSYSNICVARSWIWRRIFDWGGRLAAWRSGSSTFAATCLSFSDRKGCSRICDHYVEPVCIRCCGLTIRSSRAHFVAALRALRYASAHRRLLRGPA